MYRFLLPMLLLLCSCASSRKLTERTEMESRTDSTSINSEISVAAKTNEETQVSEEMVVTVQRMDGDTLKIESVTTTVTNRNVVRVRTDTVYVCVHDTLYAQTESTAVVAENTDRRRNIFRVELIEFLVLILIFVMFGKNHK